jgi:hypothetical protein
MGFFEFQPGDGTKPDDWRVATEIWMFWVVSGVLTGFTIIAWIIWNGKIRQRFLLSAKWESRINSLRGKSNKRA